METAMPAGSIARWTSRLMGRPPVQSTPPAGNTAISALLATAPGDMGAWSAHIRLISGERLRVVILEDGASAFEAYRHGRNAAVMMIHWDHVASIWDIQPFRLGDPEMH